MIQLSEAGRGDTISLPAIYHQRALAQWPREMMAAVQRIRGRERLQREKMEHPRDTREGRGRRCPLIAPPPVTLRWGRELCNINDLV